MAGQPSFEWPPKRFKEGVEWCVKFKLIEKFQNPDTLRELYTKTLNALTGTSAGWINWKFFLVGLSARLLDLVKGMKEYAALQKERGDEAIWDLTFSVFLAMENNDIVPGLFVGGGYKPS